MMAGARLRPIDIFLFITLLIASDDIVLRVPVGAFPIRLAQILQGILTVTGFLLLSLRGTVTFAVGWHYLVAWCILNWASSSSSSNLAFTYFFAAWLTIFIIYIFGMVQLYATVPIGYVYLLSKAYLLSFVCLAVFGIAQFALGVCGIDVLVAQWWSPHLPRVNGVSYEPSYYATYLIIGWGMTLSLLRSGSTIFRSSTLTWFFLLISAAIFISSSRIGIACCVVYLLVLLGKDVLLGITTGKMRVSTIFYVGVIAVVVIIALLPMRLTSVDWESASFLLEGTGLFGTTTHSAERSEGAWQTLLVWFDNPVFGVGLGGVWAKMSELTGERPAAATGMNIFAEILAGTGVVGFSLFFIYLIILLRACFSRANESENELTHCLRALGVGLILAMAILQFNQNILRVYIWNHFAIISIVVATVHRVRKVAS